MNSPDHFRQHGFVVVRGALDPTEVNHYRHLLIQRSGIDPQTYTVSSRGRTSWNLTDGVTKEPEFWELIFHPRLHEAVETCVGAGFKYLQHSDLQVGFSAVAWHRDNVNRTYGVGPDWDESDGPYGLVRVGIYLQEYATSGFELGFIPGSHRADPSASHRLQELSFTARGALAYLGPRVQKSTKAARWVATEPGDAIVFDPRILHSGSYIRGLKLSMFVGFGQPNRHFADLQNYYRNVRTELGYQPFSPELARRLADADLLATVEDRQTVEDAYLPAAPVRRIVARRVRH